MAINMALLGGLGLKVHSSREVYICFCLMLQVERGEEGLQLWYLHVGRLVFRNSLGVFFFLFIFSIPNKAERVKWGREKNIFKIYKKLWELLF